VFLLIAKEGLYLESKTLGLALLIGLIIFSGLAYIFVLSDSFLFTGLNLLIYFDVYGLFLPTVAVVLFVFCEK
jgi:hypothetical protein